MGEAVGIAPSAEEAASALEELQGPERLDCIRSAIESFGPSEEVAVTVEDPEPVAEGEEGTMVRLLEVDTRSKSLDSTTIVSFRSGRCVATLLFLLKGGGTGKAFLDNLTGRAYRRACRCRHHLPIAPSAGVAETSGWRWSSHRLFGAGDLLATLGWHQTCLNFFKFSALIGVLMLGFLGCHRGDRRAPPGLSRDLPDLPLGVLAVLAGLFPPPPPGARPRRRVATPTSGRSGESSASESASTSRCCSGR